MINVRLNPIVLLADLRRMFYSISYNSDQIIEPDLILRFFTHISAAAPGPFQMKTENACAFKCNCAKCQKEKPKADHETLNH